MHYRIDRIGSYPAKKFKKNLPIRDCEKKPATTIIHSQPCCKKIFTLPAVVDGCKSGHEVDGRPYTWE